VAVAVVLAVVLAVGGAATYLVTVLVIVTVAGGLPSELFDELPPHPASTATAAIAATDATNGRRRGIRSFFYPRGLDSCGLEEQTVQTILARQLGVEREREDPALTHGDRVPVDLGQDLDARAVLRDPGRADENGVHRTALYAGDVEVGLEGVQLTAEGVSQREDIEDPKMLAVENDHARAGSEDRQAARGGLTQRVPEALTLDPERHRGRLSAREDERVEVSQVGGNANLAGIDAEARKHALMRLEAALQREDADQR
jgi:hypothetical protein